MLFLETSLSVQTETKARFPTDFYLQGNLVSQKEQALKITLLGGYF